MLGKFPQRWSTWLSLAKFWYNTNYHISLELIPFWALCSISPPLHVPYLPSDSLVAAIDRMLSENEDMFQVLKHQLSRIEHRMKQLAGKHQSERSFQIGDLVFLKLQPYKKLSVKSGSVHKFAAKFYGPFKVKDKIGKVTYQLELHSSA